MRTLNRTLLAISSALFTLSATADIGQVDQHELIQSLGKPVEKKAEKVDGCNLTRYKFADKSTGVTVEFRCDRINVGWLNAPEPELAEIAKRNREIAVRAMASLSGGDGHEVEQAIQGEVFRGKSLLSSLVLSGSCVGDMCLLTFR